MIRRGLVLAAVLSAALALAAPAAAAPGVDDDGTADVIARGGDGRLWLFPGDGAAPPANPWDWTKRRIVGSDWNFVDRMLLSDVTGDDRQDIVAREGTLLGGTLWIYPYDTTQPDTPWTTRIFAGFGWNIAIVIMAGDITGDGRTDIVTRESDGQMWLYPQGDDPNNPYQTRQVIGANWQRTTALMLADATGDGQLDVIARDLDGFLWVYPRSSTKTAVYWDFLAPQRLAAAAPYNAGAGWERYSQLTATDVTGDGRPDMLGRDSTGTLWVYPHNGAAPGTSPWPTAYPMGNWWGQYTAILAA